MTQSIAEKRPSGIRTDNEGATMLNVQSSLMAAMTMPAMAHPFGKCPSISDGTAIPATNSPRAAVCATPPAMNPNSWNPLIVSNVLAIPGCDSTQVIMPEDARKIEEAIPPNNAICGPLAVTPRNLSLLVADAV